MLKRLALVFSIVFILLLLSAFNFEYAFKEYGGKEYFYKGPKSSFATEKEGDILNFLGISGQASFIAGKKDASEIINGLKAKIIFEENIDGIKNYYCYSPHLRYGITLNGKTVNLHVSLSDKGIKLGSPVIFGSY